MKENSDKVESVISENRVKLHVFKPSGRKIWTVVGKENEHWLDPDLNFCSCEDFFFNTLNGGRECYHLKSAKIASKRKKVNVIRFSDDEYTNFVSAMISDL
ncbi:MAG: hypothetical protein ACE5JT_01485 [Nitrosopumilaceae archaeon]